MTLPLFIVAMVLFGAASAFFLPASDGLVQQTVSRRNLQSANALLSTSRNTLNVFGPVVSGTLIAAFGTGWVFANRRGQLRGERLLPAAAAGRLA